MRFDQPGNICWKHGRHHLKNNAKFPKNMDKNQAVSPYFPMSSPPLVCLTVKNPYGIIHTFFPNIRSMLFLLL